MKAFVVAGTHSGVGKTAVTLGLLAALQRRGCRVQGFKIGPDFIDPGHHTTITGTPSVNLDGWMLSRAYNQQRFVRALRGVDVGIVEGVMGLFDGYDGKTEAGSTAEMAKWLGLPVILVVDASAMARSVAALIHGFQSFDQDLKVVGVIFNRIGGSGHLPYLLDALAGGPPVTVFGGLPQNDAVVIPERHLGLVTQEEHRLTPERVAQLASFIESNLELDLLLHTVQSSLSAFRIPHSAISRKTGKGTNRVRFGVARDEAFCFYYPDNLELLERAGAELIFFSPIYDRHLPTDLQGLYLGGGYPEVHAEKLAANTSMLREVRAFIEDGQVVYAECGGFMYLTSGIRDVQGHVFPLVGIYPTMIRMLPHLHALGYVEVTIEETVGPFPPGRIRGHEFHYSELADKDFCCDPIKTLYHVRKRQSDVPRCEGYLYKRCLASYLHLHFGSNPKFAASLVTAAETAVPSHR